MATVTHTIQHTRENTDTPWVELSESFQARIDHFKGTGDLVSFETVDHDALSSTTTIVFASPEAETTVITDPDWVAFVQSLQDDYTSKGFGYTENRT
jgi:hypothetical protein